jgi:LacI family transcriptional regulator
MATIYDVAKRAGTSVATVSAVVNNSAYVSPELRERVEIAITELDYNPNLVARSLAKKKTFTIGMLIPDIANPFFPEVVRGAEDKAKEAGYTILLGNSDNRSDMEETYLNLFFSKQVDGILLIKGSEELSDNFRQKLEDTGTPLVLVDRESESIKADSVVADDVGGARTAVDHLIALGHQRIGIITGFPNVSTSKGRLQGYRKALQSHQLEYDATLVEAGDYGTESGYRAGVRLLQQEPTAVFVTNFLMTVGFMKALEEAGLRCPEDVAVVSYDDFMWSEFFRPRLTGVEQPKYQIGYQSTELLLRRLADKQKKTEKIVLENRLRIRESCGQQKR